MPPAELATSLTVTEADRLLQAEAVVREYCGWHIGPARTETLTIEQVDGEILDLPSLHVTAISEIRVADVPLEATAFRWRAHGVIERRGGWWGCDPVEVDLTHGYTPIPADVTGVVQAIAQRALNNPGGIVRSQVGQVSQTYSQSGFNQTIPLAILDAEKSILDHYRIRHP